VSDDLGWDEFMRVDMRVGRIVEVEDFPEARRPAWKLRVDFGEQIGTRRSSAQITNYERDELVGRRVIGVVNFPPKQIGPVLMDAFPFAGRRCERVTVAVLNRLGLPD